MIASAIAIGSNTHLILEHLRDDFGTEGRVITWKSL
jgi:hypothetical protein